MNGKNLQSVLRVTIGSVLLSNLVTFVAFLVLVGSVEPIGFVIATIVPSLVAPPSTWYVIKQHATIAEMHKQLERAYEELKRQAQIDDLTGLLNRAAFFDLANFVHDAGSTASFLAIDADHFKLINDTYGHHEGDEALRQIAKNIKRSVRSKDIVGRLGGEEFGVYCPDISQDAAIQIAEQICESVRKQHLSTISGVDHILTVSVGCVYGTVENELRTMAQTADALLYHAKEAGRDRVSEARMTDILHEISRGRSVA